MPSVSSRKSNQRFQYLRAFDEPEDIHDGQSRSAMQDELPTQSPRVMGMQDLLIPVTLRDLGYKNDDPTHCESHFQFFDQLQDRLVNISLPSSAMRAFTAGFASAAAQSRPSAGVRPQDDQSADKGPAEAGQS
jgi:hypothetical protein